MKRILGDEFSFFGIGDDTLLPAGAALAQSDLQRAELIEHTFPKSIFDSQLPGGASSNFSLLALEPHANGTLTIAHNDEQSGAFASTHAVGPQAATLVGASIPANETQAVLFETAHLGAQDPQGDLEMGDVEIDDQEVPYFVGFDPTSPAGQLETQTPALGTSFNTITRQQTGFIPPDPIGAAGPNHLVDAVNANIQFYTKSGVQQDSKTLDTFFGQTASHFLFDPKVLYDNSAGRFLVVADELAGAGTGIKTDDVSRIHVAVSDDSDPNGTWYSFSFNSLLSDGTNNYWGDYPTVGVDEQAIYVSENFFPTESGGNALSRMWIIPKANFYSTGATPTVTFTNPNAATGFGFDVFTWQPAQVIGDINGATTGTYLVGYSGLHFNSGPNAGQEVVEVLRVDNPLNATPTYTASQILVGDISSNVHVDAPQSGSGTAINTGDERALQALWYNNHLYATTTVNPGNGQATAHWFDFNATGVGAVTLAQQGNIDGEDIAPGTHTFFPSVAVNTQGTIAFGFAASAPSIFAGSYFTQHTAADASGTVENSQVLRAGLDSYALIDNIGRNRWGDYTGISVDPANDSFWAFNESALSKGAGNGEWGTAWGNFGAPSSGSVAIGDMSITEGNSGTQVATLTVTRSGGTAAFAVDFATADGSATVADHDYVANAGTLNFGVGVNTQTISITINGDTKFESNEAFFVNLSGATNGATISDSQGIGTITNDDAAHAPHDFDANGHSDILWHNDNGADSIWDNGQIGGAHIIAAAGAVPASWHIAGKADFDGNSHGDILWRNDDGSVSIWDNGAIGGAHIISGAGVVPNSWHIAGTGDFDGNAHDDILWRNDNGAVSIWDDGQIANAHIISAAGVVPNSWHIAGTGDFDGNGHSDILWRNDNGAASIWDDGQIGNAHIIAAAGVIPSGWNIAGTGDFDGNHHDDILWRNDNGAVSIWDDGQIGGAHIVSAAGVVPNSWHISDTGDFDANGHSDILWRNDNGAASIWDDGAIANAHIIANAGDIPAGWHIV